MKIVAVLVETETQTMVWPIADLTEARTYCDDEEPVKLVTLSESDAAVKQARKDAMEEAKQACLNEHVLESVNAEKGHESDLAYNRALVHASTAIESLKGTP